jgi:diamine N-acetyltransferase
MIYTAKNKAKILIRKLETTDFLKLNSYLENLSEASKKRFGPHPFDLTSILAFYEHGYDTGYIGYDLDKEEIVAYSIIKNGVLDDDNNRYTNYNLPLNQQTDVTFAPSVADTWQSQGVGDTMFQFIHAELRKTQAKRIILWAGVQATNEKAINYYKKNGFKKVGEFSTSVENYDMYLEV